MERYFKKASTIKATPSFTKDSSYSKCSKQSELEIMLANLPSDPGCRTRIIDYDPNIRDHIRRAYLLRGPCQPRNHVFPQRQIGNYSRRFISSWFNDYPGWLKYSICKDAVFCLCCYLFKPENGDQAGGDAFTHDGFSNWKKKDRLQIHIGGPGSIHNQASQNCLALMNQRQHLETIVIKQLDKARVDYRTCLNASIDCIRFLLRQGLAFRGHNEMETSSNRGNFLELLKFLADHNEDVKVVMDNAPGNLKLTAPAIQKDIVNAMATKTVDVILDDMKDQMFSILIDESRDVSKKEQMAIVFRYVDKKGQVIERFVGIEHVSSTTSESLKNAIDDLLSRHNLSISMLRGQGYDGASNMQGELNGLKTLILRENECAYYVHCFAHQLQLALVAVAKNHIQIASFFVLVSNVVNVVGASCKRCDMLREKQQIQVMEAIQNHEILSGKGLNQETSLKRAGDTRWGSHYGTLMSMISMFTPIVEVLELIIEDGVSLDQRGEANNLFELMQSFHFVFCLFLMKAILGITNELSQALQRKDQNIVNAMALVKACKQQLQIMRDSGWDILLDKVSSFCGNHNIDILNMDDVFVARGRSRRRVEEMTNLHYYHVDIFYMVIDKQLQELNNRFNEVNTELLLCMACLSPDDSFVAFDMQKLLCLARFYPKDFSNIELMALEDQLGTYISDMRLSSEVFEVKGIGGLAQKMVETGRNKVYPLVYLLVTLALLLPVATASVERAFSLMNIVKSPLRNRIGDQWLNDSLVVYIEKDVFDSIGNDVIMERFQTMKTRRGQL